MIRIRQAMHRRVERIIVPSNFEIRRVFLIFQDLASTDGLRLKVLGQCSRVVQERGSQSSPFQPALCPIATPINPEQMALTIAAAIVEGIRQTNPPSRAGAFLMHCWDATSAEELPRTSKQPI